MYMRGWNNSYYLCENKTRGLKWILNGKNENTSCFIACVCILYDMYACMCNKWKTYTQTHKYVNIQTFKIFIFLLSIYSCQPIFYTNSHLIYSQNNTDKSPTSACHIIKKSFNIFLNRTLPGVLQGRRIHERLLLNIVAGRLLPIITVTVDVKQASWNWRFSEWSLACVSVWPTEEWTSCGSRLDPAVALARIVTFKMLEDKALI